MVKKVLIYSLLFFSLSATADNQKPEYAGQNLMLSPMERGFDAEKYKKMFSNSLPKSEKYAEPQLKKWKQKFTSEAEKPNVYILISSSMPMELIRAYALDAITYNARLIYKGIDPNHRLMWFAKRYILPLRGKKLAPTVDINPVPFSLWKVDSVPTIVFSKKEPICGETFDAGGFKDCKPAPENTYWKMSGAVDVTWALRQFKDEGAPIPEGFIRDGGKIKTANPLDKDSYSAMLTIIGNMGKNTKVDPLSAWELKK